MTIFEVEVSGQIRPESSEVPDDDAGDTAAALVMAAATGDQQAWDALVDRFAPTVWAVARGYRLSVADATDVSEVTWLRLVENLDRMEEPDRVGAWLATTARRESRRVLCLTGRTGS